MERNRIIEDRILSVLNIKKYLKNYFVLFCLVLWNALNVWINIIFKHNFNQDSEIHDNSRTKGRQRFVLVTKCLNV